MGLDIYYCSYIKKIEKVINEDEDFDDNFHIYDQGFHYQLGSLKVGDVYSETEESETDGFRAGSYSGYNDWRNKLSIMAGYGPAENVWNDFNTYLRYLKLKIINGEDIVMKPFYELINFSDCEGVIGPEICKKLHQDFIDFNHIAKNQDEYFYNKYLEWTKAFYIASQNGLIKFC